MKPKQLTLSVDAAHTLTERQTFALDQIRAAGTVGIRADALGALLHTRKLFGHHEAGERCAWCKGDGLAMLRRLRELGYVKQRGRIAVWVAVDAKPRGMTDEIPY